MKISPLVSVICVCYNHQDYVIDALESILMQNYDSIELIITDDGSTDHSQAIIKKWCEKHLNVLFLPNKSNIGYTKTFNNAIKHAKGEYIIDFAADDYMFSDCIASQINCFQNSSFKNLAIVYANINLCDEKNNFLGNYYTENDHPESGDIYKMVIGQTVRLCSVASMIKKDIFEKLGYYDTSLAFEDLDLWVRVSRDYDIEYIPKILVKKRELSTSLSAHFNKKKSKKTLLIQESLLKVLNKISSYNRTKQEHSIFLNRILFHSYEFIHSRNYLGFLKISFLYFKTFLKSF